MTEPEPYKTILNKLAAAFKEIIIQHGYGHKIPSQQPCGLTLFLFYDTLPNGGGVTTLSLGHVGIEPLLEYILNHMQPQNNLSPEKTPPNYVA